MTRYFGFGNTSTFSLYIYFRYLFGFRNMAKLPTSSELNTESTLTVCVVLFHCVLRFPFRNK